MPADSLAMLSIFLILSLGLILGKVRIKGVSLDYGAVILVGLVSGYYGVRIPEIFQTMGLVFFVFSVGMQAGPGFLSSLGRNGWKLMVPTAGMILMSLGLALGLGRAFSLDPSLVLGLLTGGRSSNTALAVAVQTSGSEMPALGHAISYPLAVLSIILFVRLLPVLFRIDFRKEEELYRQNLEKEHPPLENRMFQVENPEAFGKTLDSLRLGQVTGANISRIMHQGIILLPRGNLTLHQGDLVKAVGLPQDLKVLEGVLGPESSADFFYDIPLDLKHEAQWLSVTRKEAVNLPLSRLGLREFYGATVTRLLRSGVEISPRGSTVLRYGDKIMVVAGKSQGEALKNYIGDQKRTVDKDFLPFFLIVLAGLAIGTVPVPLGAGVAVSLGSSGGVLAASLVFSALGKTGKILWAVSESSLSFIRHLGLLLFLGAVGTQSGGKIIPAFQSEGAVLVGVVLAISLVPLLALVLAGRFILKMDFGSLLGLVSGATTCSPALGIANTLTGSGGPDVTYAAVYPFTMLFMMICVQILGLLTVAA